MANIEKMIDFAMAKRGKVGYSMAYPKRLGPDFYDCSSFVYYGLIAGGFLKKGHPIGNTETLYKLRGKIFEEVYSYKDIRRGDIFITGVEGRSAGAYGHTGIFLKKDRIIHANYPNRGVSINGPDTIGYFLRRERSYRERYFRPRAKAREKFTETLGKALVRAAVNVRAAPTTASQIVAVYYPGSSIYYDRVLENEGLTWISYIGRTSGKRRYVSTGDGTRSWVSL